MKMVVEIKLKRFGWYGVLLLDLFSPVLPKKLYGWLVVRCYTFSIKPRNPTIQTRI